MSTSLAVSPRPGRSAAPDRGADATRPLRIGDLATAAGVSPDALRYYERRGLLQPSGRRASGYREYPPEAVGAVRFIKQAQALGFTLGEVEELLRLRGAVGRPAVALEAREVAVAKLRDIDEKVRQLGALRGALAGLVAECERACGDGRTLADARDCPIIAALNDGDADQQAFPSTP
ncbi:MAG TPA: heavy metal-responsive transcriptional regulator [Gemmatirosa sp.]|nr:heavy metal-responsive transcriptional regulator [Gemmatirosa sp.]